MVPLLASCVPNLKFGLPVAVEGDRLFHEGSVHRAVLILVEVVLRQFNEQVGLSHAGCSKES